MGVFDDKKFEELDWISQATEPIDSKLNEVLGLIPDSIDINFQTYKEMIGEGYYVGLDISTAIKFVLKKYTKDDLSYEQNGIIRKMFEFEFSQDGIVIDFEKETITYGEIKLIKLASTMDEKVLENLLGKEGIAVVSSMFSAGAGLNRANEIMELLGGCESGLRTRSERKKRYFIKERLVKLFKNNEWKIKDTELANKVGYWIKSYIADGNLAAYSNFCRLKVMTHKDQPIYSMVEIE